MGEKILRILLSIPVMIFLCFFGSVPFIWPILSEKEGEWFPVLVNVHVFDAFETDSGLGVFVKFDKVRYCEFVGIGWYDEFGTRASIDYFPDNDDIPMTRSVGDEQSAGPWIISGLTKLEGTRAKVVHRCHPLWDTYTNFYPEGIKYDLSSRKEL